jgi:hypothetical protein
MKLNSIVQISNVSCSQNRVTQSISKLQQQTVGLAESRVYPNELLYPSVSICVKSSLDEFPVKPVRKPWMLLKDTLNTRLKRLEYTVNKTTDLRFACVTHVTAWMREFSLFCTIVKLKPLFVDSLTSCPMVHFRKTQSCMII